MPRLWQFLRLHDLNDSAAWPWPAYRWKFAPSSVALWCCRVGIRGCGKTHFQPSQIYLVFRFNGCANPRFKSAFQSIVAVAVPSEFRTHVHFGLPLSVATLVFFFLLKDRESLCLSFLLMFHCLLRMDKLAQFEWFDIHIFDNFSASRCEGVFGVVSVRLPKTSATCSVGMSKCCSDVSASTNPWCKEQFRKERQKEFGFDRQPKHECVFVPLVGSLQARHGPLDRRHVRAVGARVALRRRFPTTQYASAQDSIGLPINVSSDGDAE